MFSNDRDSFRKKIRSQALLRSGFLTLHSFSHSDASAEATHIISAISEVPSVPAPCDTEGAAAKGTSCLISRRPVWPHLYQSDMFIIISLLSCSICLWFCPAECKDCESPVEGHPNEELPVVKEALKERPAEEVTAILAQQEKEETDVLTCRLELLEVCKM